MSLLLIASGGFLGACSRYYISLWLNGKGRWKITGTWTVNMVGSGLLALLWFSPSSESLWLFAGTGFSGAFTTFSTFGKETVDLYAQGNPRGALMYVCFSVFLSLLIIHIVSLLVFI